MHKNKYKGTVYAIREDSNGSESDNKSGDQLWCVCRTSDSSRFMIACDYCEEWYHGDCINVTPKMAESINTYFCTWCQKKNPSLKILYKSGTLINKPKEKIIEKFDKRDKIEKFEKIEKLEKFDKIEKYVDRSERPKLKLEEKLSIPPMKSYKINKFPNCGECMGCLRKVDCNVCQNCRAKTGLGCLRRMCQKKQQAPSIDKPIVKLEDKVLLTKLPHDFIPAKSFSGKKINVNKPLLANQSTRASSSSSVSSNDQRRPPKRRMSSHSSSSNGSIVSMNKKRSYQVPPKKKCKLIEERHFGKSEKERYSTKLDQDRFFVKSDHERHFMKPDQERHSTKVDQERYSTKLDQERHSTKLDQERHSTKLDQERQSLKPDKDRHSIKVLQERHLQNPEELYSMKHEQERYSGKQEQEHYPLKQEQERYAVKQEHERYSVRQEQERPSLKSQHERHSMTTEPERYPLKGEQERPNQLGSSQYRPRSVGSVESDNEEEDIEEEDDDDVDDDELSESEESVESEESPSEIEEKRPRLAHSKEVKKPRIKHIIHRPLKKTTIRPNNIHKLPRRTMTRQSKPEPIKNYKSFDCYNIGCNKPSRMGSKYCSDECGVNIAEQRLLKYLPERIINWNNSVSISDEKDKVKQLEIMEEIKTIHYNLDILSTSHQDLTEFIERWRSSCSAVTSLESATSDDNVQCVTCGVMLNSLKALAHMESCFQKIEGNTMVFADFEEQPIGTKLFCDHYDNNIRGYCKRLAALCDHTKDPKVDPKTICAFPLSVNEKSDKVCMTAKVKCNRHINWERIQRGVIDINRYRLLARYEELGMEERKLKMNSSQRGGVIALLTHETVDHQPMKPMLPNRDSSNQDKKMKKFTKAVCI